MDDGSSSSDVEDGTSGVFPVELITSEGRGRDYIASRAIASDELVLRVAPVRASLGHCETHVQYIHFA